MALPGQMGTDYQNFWKNTPVGGSVDFAGGKLQRSDTHGASQGEQTGMWTGANGQQASMTTNSDLNQLALNNPDMAKQWKTQYGFAPDANAQYGSGIANDYFNPSHGPSAQVTPNAQPAQSQAQGTPNTSPPNLGMGSPVSGSPSSGTGDNPYLQQQGDNITRQVTQNLQRNIMPGIGQAAQGAGQYGGSRQGVAQGIAAGDASKDIAGQLSNLYGNAYTFDKSNATQNKSIDNSYNLGLGNLGLQGQSQQNNFYSTNRGQDMEQMRLGAGLYGMGNQGNLGIGQAQYGLGSQVQNNGYDALNQYSNSVRPYTGLNGSTTNTNGNQNQNNWGTAIGAGTLGLGIWDAAGGTNGISNWWKGKRN